MDIYLLGVIWSMSHDPIESHFDTTAIKTIIKRAIPKTEHAKVDEMYERTLVGDQNTMSFANWGVKQVKDNSAKMSLRRFLK